MEANEKFDVVIIGGGPAGQKAAIQASKANRSVVVIDRECCPGGACVRTGTIPSKALHETANSVLRMKRTDTGLLGAEAMLNVPLINMMSRVSEIVSAHQDYMGDQLRRNGVVYWHGRAKFVGDKLIEVEGLSGDKRRVSGDIVVIATGSSPRDPDNLIVDHENILDSDSILSLTYLPKTLTVLGAGVIAAEYASIFATLGVEVTMIDRGPLPLGFVDAELTARFVADFEATGSQYIGEAKLDSVIFDGISGVTTRLEDGREFSAEKCLFALGRIANLAPLKIERTGLKATERGLLVVSENYETEVPGIYAVGDVIASPALAAAAMEQGRRAICHAFNLGTQGSGSLIPTGIYTIPEISSVGMSAAAAAEQGGCIIGRANFAELARAHIAGTSGGVLRLIADAKGQKILGVDGIGSGLTELIHMGQIAIESGWEVDHFVENIFNFPTYAEAYRVAALDIVEQRAAMQQPETLSVL